MKVSKIREMTSQEISENINSLKKSLFGLRFQCEINQLENTSALSHLKKDIARCKTVLTERHKLIDK